MRSPNPPKAGRALAAIVAAVAVLLTTACGTDRSSGDPEPSTPPPKDDQVTLAAPEVADDTDLEVRVTAPAGTEVTLYAFTSEWENKKPACTDTEQGPLRTVRVGESGEASTRVSMPRPGVWWWMFTAPGYTSDCGALSTRVRVTPDLWLSGEESYWPPSSHPAGEPFAFFVETDTESPEPLDDSWPVIAEWYGPYDSAPAAENANCGSSEPVALTTKGKASPDNPAALTVTPSKPGVYRINARVAETKWNTAADTGCDFVEPVVIE